MDNYTYIRIYMYVAFLNMYRGIWDSYIDDQQGSTMPSGWILPNEEQNRWSHMLQNPNESNFINPHYPF